MAPRQSCPEQPPWRAPRSRAQSAREPRLSLMKRGTRIGSRYGSRNRERALDALASVARPGAIDDHRIPGGRAGNGTGAGCAGRRPDTRDLGASTAVRACPRRVGGEVLVRAARDDPGDDVAATPEDLGSRVEYRVEIRRTVDPPGCRHALRRRRRLSG